MNATQTQDFLGQSSLIDTGFTDVVVLHAPYDVTLFNADLFAQFEMPFPDHLSRAVDKRQADYLAGRALVARGFDALDLPPHPVETGPDRAPIWPNGVTGSISHSRKTCACILSTDTTLHLGIDVETNLTAKSDEAIRNVALSEHEQKLLNTAPDPRHLSALMFCAKETLFKALYPTVQTFFGFDSAEVMHLPDDTHIQLRLTKTLHPILPAETSFDIRHLQLEDQVLTWLICRI